MTNISNITGKYEQAYLNETAEKQVAQPVNAPETTVEAAETERPDDKVSLSNASREMQAAEEAVAATPDVRQDRVDEIKMAVESGNYDMDPAKIADKMVGAMVNEMV
jgi:negative regulator of flagellin synthesis FlgM